MFRTKSAVFCQTIQLLTTSLLVLVIAIPFSLGDTSEKSENCDSAKMMNCLLSLGESAEKERLFFPDTPEKLHNYCSHLMKGLECASQLIDKCATEEEKHIYQNLTVDMVGMNVALCTDGSPLSMRFLKHVGCYKELSERFQVCSDRYIGNIIVVHGLTHEQQIKMTCCTVHEYSRCMRNVVSGRCEKEAADLVEETVVKTLSTSMHYCNQMRDIPSRDCRKKFTAVHSQSSSGGDMDDEENGGKLSSTPMSILLLLLILVRLMLFR